MTEKRISTIRRNNSPQPSKDNQIKKYIQDAVIEVLSSDQFMDRLVESISVNVIKKQATLLEEMVDIIEDDLKEINESISNKIAHQEQLIESINVNSSDGTYLANDSESITRNFLSEQYKAKKGGTRDTYEEVDNISLKGRRNANTAPSGKLTKERSIANAINEKLGINVLEGIDLGLAAERHSDDMGIMGGYGEYEEEIYDDNMPDMQAGSYSLSEEEKRQYFNEQ